MTTKSVLDFRKNPLDVGTLVAYNLSGEIAIGIIESWKEIPWPEHRSAWMKQNPRYEFKVKVVESHRLKAGHISTVTSQYNLMALVDLSYLKY